MDQMVDLDNLTPYILLEQSEEVQYLPTWGIIFCDETKPSPKLMCAFFKRKFEHFSVGSERLKRDVGETFRERKHIH